MAEIGKRISVGDLLGFKVHGFIAWWIWRTYYLANLPINIAPMSTIWTNEHVLQIYGCALALYYRPTVS